MTFVLKEKNSSNIIVRPSRNIHFIFVTRTCARDVALTSKFGSSPGFTCSFIHLLLIREKGTENGSFYSFDDFPSGKCLDNHICDREVGFP